MAPRCTWQTKGGTEGRGTRPRAPGSWHQPSVQQVPVSEIPRSLLLPRQEASAPRSGDSLSVEDASESSNPSLLAQQPPTELAPAFQWGEAECPPCASHGLRCGDYGDKPTMSPAGAVSASQLVCPLPPPCLQGSGQAQ